MERWWIMILLTKRQEAILYYILQGKESITTKKLASKYQLSERMIHYDLEYISRWLKERDCRLSKTKNRYRVEISDEQRFIILEELFHDDIQHRILTKADRYEYIYQKLLLANGVVPSDDIMDDLQVSKPTVLNDLKEVEHIAARSNLSVRSKKGAGYWLEGREIDIRRQLIQVLTRTLIQNHIQSYEQLRAALGADSDGIRGHYLLAVGYIGAIDIEPICEILNDLRAHDEVTISDIDSFALFVSIAVMVRRLLGSHVLTKESILQIQKGEEARSYILGRDICERLEEEYEIHCSKVEVNYMILTLISTNVSFLDTADGKDHLEGTVEQMLQNLKSYPSVTIDSLHMEELKEETKEYLSLLIRKRKLGIKSQNPLLAQTQAEYPELFSEAAKMAEVFSVKEGLKLTQEEIGVLTVYIAAYSDQRHRGERKKAVIVCDEGKSIARLLKNRIKNNITNLSIIRFVSVYELSQNKQILKDADFVISTVKLSDVDLPVFCVNPIISAIDIRSINDFVTGRKSIQVVVDAQKKENYLKNAVINGLTKYIDPAKISDIKNELDYFLSAGSNLISLENSKLIKEEYAYKVSMVLVKLSDLFKQIHEVRGKKLDVDIMMGLAIHVTMSAARWEQKEFYPEKTAAEYDQNEQKLFQKVERFLEEVSEIFHHEIAKCEAAAIMRYLI